MALTIGIDVGGTKVAAGVVDENGKIIEHLRRPTPAQEPDKVAEVIAEVVRELSSRHTVDAVGLGAAGFVDETRSVLRFAPNLAWREEPLREKVGALIDLPVVVENDANAMAWGEYRFGAGRGESHVVCVTVGTGIGGGLVLDGRLYRGRWGMGAEWGHTQMVPGGRPCGCGNQGCWERYASGSALVADVREAIAADPARGARLLEMAGGSLENAEGEVVAAAAHEGDPVALEAFALLARWLGQGLADLAATLDPGCFIIGGGVSRSADLFLDAAREEYARRVVGRGHRPLAVIKAAELGPAAGLVGAADLARTR
ncbi:ROK family glucokinase [Thermopolyspora sp. NPDC052614]|uniref:ROK family glucokinase n=1 Tax=Thermopolyspora sp. NPDC052614 TaxID=3155682 RepID=UPI00343E65C4